MAGPSSSHLELPSEQRRRSEGRGAEGAGVDAEAAVEAVACGLSGEEADGGVGEAGDVGEADGDVDGDDGVLVRPEGESEGELDGGGVGVLEDEVARDG